MSSIFDGFGAKVRQFLDTTQASRATLPDGGTPAAPNPTRDDDATFIRKVAAMAASQCADRTDSAYREAEAFYIDLLTRQAELMYSSNVGSFVQRTRQVCELRSDQVGTCGDVMFYLLTTLNNASPARLRQLSDQIIDLLARIPDLGVGDSDADVEDALDATPHVATPAAAITAKSVVPDAFKTGVGGWKDALADAPDPIDNTGYIGQVAHAVIQADYCLRNPGHVVLVDRFLMRLQNGVGALLANVLPAFSDPTELLLTKATGALADLLRAGLPGNSAGLFKQPDILDATTHEVYEIKPVKGAGKGLTQVFGYLLTLNEEVLGTQTAAATLLRAQTLAGGVNPTGNKDVWLPGYRWLPAPAYEVPLSDTQLMMIMADRPVPGLILYYAYVIKRKPSIAEDAIMTGVIVLVALAVLAAPELAVAEVGGGVADAFAAAAAAANDNIEFAPAATGAAVDVARAAGVAAAVVAQRAAAAPHK